MIDDDDFLWIGDTLVNLAAVVSVHFDASGAMRIRLFGDHPGIDSMTVEPEKAAAYREIFEKRFRLGIPSAPVGFVAAR